MRITIDYNSDKIYINPDERYERFDVRFSLPEILKNPLKYTERLLDEIFNMIEVDKDSLQLDIELETLDEDTRATIGSW